MICLWCDLTKNQNDDSQYRSHDTEGTLSEQLDGKRSRQGSGKVVLQYSSVAELDMIIDLLEQKRRNARPMMAPAPSVGGGEQPQEKFTMKIID